MIQCLKNVANQPGRFNETDRNNRGESYQGQRDSGSFSDRYNLN